MKSGKGVTHWLHPAWVPVQTINKIVLEHKEVLACQEPQDAFDDKVRYTGSGLDVCLEYIYFAHYHRRCEAATQGCYD